MPESQEQYVFTAMGSAGNLYMTKDIDRSGRVIVAAYAVAE